MWFAYQGEDWVLRGLSFRVEPGERVAIVGATGAGKTTIIQLLTRLYEVQRGRILLDGVDLRDLPQGELRRRIAMVLQDVFLFSGTLEEDIGLGRADIDAPTIERAARAADERPVFAAVSLISSHAPWTPIPPLVDDWAKIGDGRIFSRWAEGGDPPEVVWRDPERVRAQYVKSVGYVLDVLAAYAARFVDPNTLMIVVGDHQPAPLITGEGANRDVPIHIITGDPTLLEPFLEWGMVAGMHPSADAPVWRMDGMRDWFLATFSQQARDAISRRTGQPER